MRNSNAGFGKCHHENGHPKPKLGRKIFPSVLLATVALISSLEIQAQKKILFYGPTFKPTGVAGTLINAGGEFAPIGSNGSQVWTPGDPDPSKDWSKKTTADFKQFAAIVFEDLRYDAALQAWQHIIDPNTWRGAIQNVNTWSAAVNGNVLLVGGDPEAHWNGCDHPLFPCGGDTLEPGAQALIQNGIRFASDEYQNGEGTGIYIALSSVDPNLDSPIDPMRKGISHFLSGLGEFGAIHIDMDQSFPAEQIRKIYHTSFFSTLPEEEGTGLSVWNDSAHLGFTSWPTEYFPLTLAIDAPPWQQTPAELIAPYKGLVTILAKNPGNALKTFYLNPMTKAQVVNSSHEFTAHFKDQFGNEISGQVDYELQSGSVNETVTI